MLLVCAMLSVPLFAVGAAEPGVIVNEILTKSDDPLEDAIELYNPTAAAVNLSDWFLTDDQATPRKYRIPANTVIDAGGYLVFYHSQFGSRFALNGDGEEVYLFAADTAGNLTGYSHGFQFGAADANVSFGRFITSTGEEFFPAQVRRTLGGPNAGPLIGPVIIHEIMYNPPKGGDEFIELRNITNAAVPLYDPNSPSNTWKVGGIGGYIFPQNVEIAAQGLLLLVQIDPAVFRVKYHVPDAVPILGPYPGALANNGEDLELLRPGQPETQPGGNQVTVPYVSVEAVSYKNVAPWPTAPDGNGPSLERTNSGFGSDPANWHASTISGGTPGRMPSFDHDGDGIPDDVDTDDDNDGYSDVDELALGTNPLDPASKPGGSADFDSDGLTDDVDTDDDNDGVTDQNEISDGTNPYDAASFLRKPLLIRKITGRVSFTATGRDSCSVLGVIPAVPALFKPQGAVVRVNAGGVEVPFVLDGSARAKSGKNTLSLTLKPSKRNPATNQLDFLGGNVVFKAAFKQGAFLAAWKLFGVNPTLTRSKVFLDMPLDVRFNGRVYSAVTTTQYSSKRARGAVLIAPVPKPNKKNK